MIYEKMKTEHVDEVESLQREWASENITYGYLADTAEQLAKSITPYCLIAKDDQKIVGYLTAEIRHDNEACIFPNGVSYLEVNDLFVTKDYRSHGVGWELLHRCEEMARKDGIKHVYLLSATKDADAVRRFYTGNEYTIWSTTFYKNLD